MKNKLKLFVATVLVFVMAFAFAACGANVNGTWVLKECSATTSGVTMDMIDMGMSMELELKDDDKFEMTVTMPAAAGGESQTMTGTWKFEDNTVTLSGEDGEDFYGVTELKLEDGKLTASHTEDGMSVSVVFEKE